MFTRFIPPEYHERYCIAGGYAACPAQARDVDVWIYRFKPIEQGDLGYFRLKVLAWLEGQVAALNVNRPIWPEKRYCLTSEEGASEFAAYEHAHCTIEKVAVVLSPVSHPQRVVPVHIMVTDAPEPGTILQGFDVSTHAVAIDYDGRIWKHNLYTHPGERPIALLDNEKTPERMARIAARFGHTLPEVTSGETITA